MADALNLLFRLQTDGSSSVAEIQRVRRTFAVEIEGIYQQVFDIIKNGRRAKVAGGRDEDDAPIM